MKSDAGNQPRAYRQKARAHAAQATALRIAEAFAHCTRTRWFDEVTLDDVATQAGVTVRTILRRFGSKDGLVAGFGALLAPGIRAERTAPAGDIRGAVHRVLGLYETLGDSVIRTLAEELRHPALKALIDQGRREHRAITAAAFAPWLEPLESRTRRRALDALVIATDVYTWKLLRRDMGRSLRDTRAVVLNMVQAVLT